MLIGLRPFPDRPCIRDCIPTVTCSDMFGPPKIFAPAPEHGDGRATGHPLIRKLGQFASLNGEEQQALARCLSARIQIVGRGIPLVEAGDAPSDLFVVLEGWACSLRPVAEGRAPIVALHLPGDVCDFGTLMKQRMEGSIVAMSRLRVATLSRPALTRLTGEHPICGQALWSDFMCASAISGQWIARLSQGSARARLANLICELAVRLYAVGLADDSGFALPITQVDLGHSCGLTPEHTNRVLRDLHSRGIASWEKGRLILRDGEALSKEGAFDPAYLHFRHLKSYAPARTP